MGEPGDSLPQPFVVSPHSDDFDGALVFDSILYYFFFNCLIHEAVLDIYPSGMETGKIANQRLARRLSGIVSQDLNQSSCLLVKSGRLEARDVLYRLLIVHNPIHLPFHILFLDTFLCSSFFPLQEGFSHSWNRI